MGGQTSRLLRFLVVVIIIISVVHPLDTLTHMLARRRRRQKAMDPRIWGAVAPQFA
jgi:hypothetical protein